MRGVGLIAPRDLERFRESSLDFTGDDFTVDGEIEAAGATDSLGRYGLEILAPLPKE